MKQPHIRVFCVWFCLTISFPLSWPVYGGELPELRVCADPDNLPFSNQHLQGFENKIAALVAEVFETTLTYAWQPQRRGFVRGTLDAKRCDVVIGVPTGSGQVL